MNLTFRLADLTDFDAFYRVCYRAFGFDSKHQASVRQEFTALLESRATVALVVEDHPHAGDSYDIADEPPVARVVGFQQIAFVNDAFAKWALSDMPPYVNVHLAYGITHGDSALVIPGQVPFEPETPYNMLITHYGWDTISLSSDEQGIVREFLFRSCAPFYRGYPLKRILVEAVGERPLRLAQAVGFSIARDYAEVFHAKNEEPAEDLKPYLMCVARDDVLPGTPREGSQVGYAFAYVVPRLTGLTREDHELLFLAFLGKSDGTIAGELNMSPGGVKRRWLALYTRIEQGSPGLLPRVDDSQFGKRGLEKRESLLHFIRSHPHELRPLPLPHPKKQSVPRKKAAQRF